jgi:hypothetical protein
MFFYNRVVFMRQDRPVKIWFQGEQFLIGKDGLVLDPLSENQIKILKKNRSTFVEVIVPTEAVISNTAEEVLSITEVQPVVVETTKAEEPSLLNNVEVPIVKKNKGGRPPKKKKELGTV